MTTSKKYRLRFLFQEIDLEPGIFHIGRSPACNLTLEDSLVSRTHVQLKISDKMVFMNDLGSRNGTTVNGTPIFDEYLLEDKDRIRIGNHEIVFLEVSIHPVRPLRPTGAMIVCSLCKTSYPMAATRCPHCNTSAIPTVSCPRCRLGASASDEYCARCGASIKRNSDTESMNLDHKSRDWTSDIMNDVIEKAISSKKFNSAAKLLQKRLDSYTEKEKQGFFDISLLLDICSHNTLLATELKQPERLDWIVNKWISANTLMPTETLDAILAASLGWHDMKLPLKKYLKILNNTEPKSPDAAALIGRIEKLLKEDLPE